MFDKLNEILNRYEYLNSLLSQIEIISDTELYKQYSIELANLEPVVQKYTEYIEVKKYLADIIEELNTCTDKETIDFYKSEINSTKDTILFIESELKQLLMPKFEDENKKVIVEIHAGVGGDEAALFASDLFDIYVKYTQQNNISLVVDDISENKNGGVKEICFTLSGKHVYNKLKYFNGVIRVQRVPETEAKGRIHTSTASIFTYVERDETEVKIDPADLDIGTCRSSGPGGQNVNKVSSCVYITHLPTGITVRSQSERSQLQNKENCMKKLATKLFEYYNAQEEENFIADKNNSIGNAARSQKILTFNYPRSEVIEHKTGNKYNLEDVLSGNLNKIIENIQLFEQTQALSL